MSPEQLFLDTAYVAALLNTRDDYHDAAVALIPRVRAASDVWTTEAVLTEVGNILSRSHRVEAVAFIAACYTTPNLHVASVDSALFRRAIDLYRSRTDKTWGLTDCISFLVMQDQGLADALTTDEHFRQAGFRPLLRRAATA